MSEEHLLDLEKDLLSFDSSTRRNALEHLQARVESSEVPLVPELPITNLHAHTFFSFNAYGYSPSAFAWEAKKRGLCAAGIVDFDVLHGAKEFLDACDLLNLRGVAGIESRVFIPEWQDREINSPKEPGIFYAMGMGFLEDAPKSFPAGQVLERMSLLARKRNEDMLLKLNPYLRDVQVDYEMEVLPLAPSGNATERHMLVAIEQKSRRVFQDPAALSAFWCQALSVKEADLMPILNKPAELQMLIRSKLMKSGGPGYVTPEAGSFPTLDEMVPMVLALGAIPTATWLDGTSEGEKSASGFLDFMIEKGVACLNVIPDRNWNISKEAERTLKIFKLHEIVQEARRRHVPVIAGTEMNKHGQKFVDDFNSEALKPLADEFLRGARILTGHTLLLKHLGFGLTSPQVKERFGKDLAFRNDFFESLGHRVPQREGTLKQSLQEAWDNLGCAAG